MPVVLRVLYVDDERDLLDIGKLFLEASGDFSVTTTDSAPGALSLLANEKFDAIISDYQMPEMDGIQFLVEVRKMLGTFPFILFTGKGREEVVIQAINNGVDFYLQKGGNPEAQFAELSHMIRQATSRKKAEEALVRSEAEARYRADDLAAMMDAMPAITFVAHDPLCLSMTSSRTAYELLNLPPSSNTSLSAPPGERPVTFRTIKDGRELSPEELPVQRAAATGQEIRNYELTFELDDGTRRTIFGNAVPLFDESERTRGAIGSFIDITEIRQAEIALAESEEKYRALFQNLQTGVVVHGPDTGILFSNPRAAHILGLTPEQMQGKKAIDPSWCFIREDGTQMPLEEYPVNLALSSDKRPSNMVLGILRPDRDGPTWVQCDSHPVRGPDGTLREIVITFVDISDRKRAEDALRKSEERFRGINDTITSGVATYEVKNDGASGKDYIIRDFNKTALEIEGKTKEEVVGKSLFDLRPTIDEYGLIPVFQQVWKTGVPAYFPQKIYTDEKYSCWYENRVFRLQSGEIIAVYDDVTERKRAEEVLAESEEKYRTLFEGMAPGVFYQSSDGALIDANPAALRMFGLSRGQFMGRDSYDPRWKVVSENGDFLPAEQHPSMLALRSGKPVRDQVVGVFNPRTEEITWLSTNAEPQFRSGEATPYRVFVTMNDITSRKRDELTIRQASERLRRFIDANIIGVVIASPSGKIIDANDYYLDLVGYTREEFEKGEVDWRAVTPPEWLPADEHALEDLRRIGVSAPYEKEYCRRDGTRVPVLLSDAMLPGPEEQVVAFVIDITERKRAEDAIRQANRKLHLLSSITRHDISNQLTVLRGYISIHEKKGDGSADTEYYQKATAAAERISALIRFTKEYESIGVNAPLWQESRNLVEIAAKEAQPGKVTLTNDLPGGEELCADPLIARVFFNLVDNAVRYGGTITTIRFRAIDRGGELVIVCEDDGNGIPAADKEKIFGKGYGKNTGMGLFLSREILAITGITIRETGEPGKGARFEITVPKGMYRTRS